MFLDDLRRRLGEGARLVFVDNRYVDGSSTPIEERDSSGNSYQIRTLEDGSRHRVLKNFPEPCEIRAALAEVARRREIVLRVIGPEPPEVPGVPVEHVPWSEEDESGALAGLDVGILPQPDDRWTRGKCAFKALQYMAAGLPVVASPVGMATEAVEDGVTGFLAGTDEALTDAIHRLLAGRIRTSIRISDRCQLMNMQKRAHEWLLAGQLADHKDGMHVWQAPFEQLNMPMIGNLRSDPFERAWHEGIGYPQWQFEHMFMYAPAGAYVARWLQSFKDFPPRQKPGSFNLDNVMAAITKGAGDK